MKKLIFFITILISLNAKSQKAEILNDVATYLNKSYKVGDKIQLGYGSANNKEFVFVNYGKTLGGVNLPLIYHHANENWGKAECEIIKVYKNSGTVWLKCKPLNAGSSVGSVMGNKIFINLEGAIDNKEIISVTTKKSASAPVPAPKKRKH